MQSQDCHDISDATFCLTQIPIGRRKYQIFLSISILFVLGVHIYQLNDDPHNFVRWDGKRHVDCAVWEHLVRHFAFLSTWSTIAVETYLVVTLSVTFTSDEKARQRKLLCRSMSCILFAATVFQIAVAISYWTAYWSVGKVEKDYDFDWWMDFSWHGGITLLFSLNFFATSILIYAVDGLVILAVGLVYLIPNIAFTIKVGQIYPGLNWAVEPLKAVVVSFSFLGVAACTYGLLLAFRAWRKSAVFSWTWSPVSDEAVDYVAQLVKFI